MWIDVEIVNEGVKERVSSIILSLRRVPQVLVSQAGARP
jgi:hypothetical protein